jgi:hypothetical protein
MRNQVQTQWEANANGPGANAAVSAPNSAARSNVMKKAQGWSG